MYIQTIECRENQIKTYNITIYMNYKMITHTHIKKYQSPQIHHIKIIIKDPLILIDIQTSA